MNDNVIKLDGNDTPLNKGIALWLEEERGLEGVTITSISDPQVDAAYGGCDTCGYGSDPERSYFTIYFSTPSTYYDYVEIEGNSLNFLATVLPYVDKVRGVTTDLG